jgi:phosphatidate phosphatase APP1
VQAVRNTLLVAEADRLPIPGAAQPYRALLAGSSHRAQVFYVSTGAWNMHAMLQRFLARNGFPDGPVMTDWGPGEAWLFREASVAFKARVITELVHDNPGVRWILVGDSGQDDAEAYATVAKAHPGRLLAIYIREAPPTSPIRAARVRRLAEKLAQIDVPMLLVANSKAAAEHSRSLGLINHHSTRAIAAAVDLAAK